MEQRDSAMHNGIDAIFGLLEMTLGTVSRKQKIWGVLPPSRV